MAVRAVIRGRGTAGAARGAPPNCEYRRARLTDRHRFVAAGVAVSHLVAALATFSAAQPVAAQVSRADTNAAIARCDSVIAAARADTARLTVEAYLSPPEGGVLPDSVVDRILNPVLTQLDLPAPLRLPVFAAAPVRMHSFAPAKDSAAALRTPVLNGVYSFTLRRDGSLRDARVRLAALAPGVDDAVLRAIAITDTLGGARVPAAFVPRGGLELQLRIAGGLAIPDRGRPLFNALVGRFPLTDARPPDSLPKLHYPRAEEEAGWEGRVLLQFAVDREGVPAMHAVELLQASSVGFAEAALEMLPKVRFSPARVNGCAVWQIVRLPVTFRLPDEGS